jgi:3-hydroxyisobutyrate dehydrogenase
MSIGFIGLGNIGKPMAQRMRALDATLWVYDIFPEPVAELAALGFKAASTPAELAANCAIIRLCVRDENDVEQLLYGTGGILEQAAAGSVVLIHSTVTQASVLRWQAEAAARHIALIDAPMTGGAAGAEAGTLCYMVGGDAAVVERCRPVLATSGNKIIHAGPVGAGIALKLCNNLMTYAELVAMHEAAKLAEACGVPVELLFEVGQSNGVVTPQMHAFLSGRNMAQQHGPEAVRRAFGGHAALGTKDLTAALKSADELGLRLPGARGNLALIEDVFLNRY